MGPEGQSVNEQVLFAAGHLHEAGEALEAAEAVMLQVNCQLICLG